MSDQVFADKATVAQVAIEAGNGAQWQTDGYYAIGTNSWDNATIKATMIYDSGQIGIIPRYYVNSTISVTSKAYILFAVENNTDGTASATFTSFLFPAPNSTSATQANHIARKDGLAVLVMGTSYDLQVEMNGSHYIAYLDGTAVFNVEYGQISSGTAAIYATAGNKCSSITVDSSLPVGWTTNAGSIDGSVATSMNLENGDPYIYMYRPQEAATNLYIRQDVTVEADKLHSVSYNYIGTVKARATEIDAMGAEIGVHDFVPETSSDFVRSCFSFTTSATTASVRLDLYLDSDCLSGSINDAQIEPTYQTSYIKGGSRDKSVITFPSKNSIDVTNGTLSIWIKPSIAYDGTLSQKPVILDYGNTAGSAFRIYHEGNSLKFSYDVNTVELANSPLAKDAWSLVIASWTNSKLTLSMNGQKTQLDGSFTFTGSSDALLVGHNDVAGYDSFFGMMDDLIIFSKLMDDDYLANLYTTTEIPQDRSEMMLRGTFDKAVGSFNKSVIEISPAPNYGSPIIVEKADGIIMNKVSFTDPYVGEYHTFNIEPVVYDGFSDYIEISYDNLDTERFEILVQDNAGTRWGDPIEAKGKRIYLSLSSQDKLMLKKQELQVTYQPKDAYTVDFNVEAPDSFRVTLGKYDNQTVKVKYEGNRSSNEKLADMIELNPLLNPNHSGFLYLTKNIQKATAIKVKTTPSDLFADGISESLVVIEPVDSNGNFISDAKFEVLAEKGLIIPSIDPGSFQLRERAGRYVFRYKAPILTLTDVGLPEIVDRINIREANSGIGVQVPITLSVQNAYSTPQTVIPSELEEEVRAAKFLGVLTDNMGKKKSECPVNNTKIPASLGDIIDLDGDGVIGIGDIVWIYNHLRTSALASKLIMLEQWLAK